MASGARPKLEDVPLSTGRRGLVTTAAVPLFIGIATPLWSGMRNGPIRLRLEARAFLNIENTLDDAVAFKASKSAKGSRLKNYLAAYNAAQLGHTHKPPPAIVGLVQAAAAQAAVAKAAALDVAPPPERPEPACASPSPQAAKQARGASPAGGGGLADAPEGQDEDEVTPAM